MRQKIKENNNLTTRCELSSKDSKDSNVTNETKIKGIEDNYTKEIKEKKEQ